MFHPHLTLCSSDHGKPSYIHAAWWIHCLTNVAQYVIKLKGWPATELVEQTWNLIVAKELTEEGIYILQKATSIHIRSPITYYTTAATLDALLVLMLSSTDTRVAAASVSGAGWSLVESFAVVVSAATTEWRWSKKRLGRCWPTTQIDHNKGERRLTGSWMAWSRKFKLSMQSLGSGRTPQRGVCQLPARLRRATRRALLNSCGWWTTTSFNDADPQPLIGRSLFSMKNFLLLSLHQSFIILTD